MIVGTWGVINFAYTISKEFTRDHKTCATRNLRYIMQIISRALLDHRKSMYAVEINNNDVLVEITYPQSQVICPMELQFNSLNLFSEVFTFVPSINILCEALDSFDIQVQYDI